ncbi:MAG: bifunctional precorrin-2 dehydrogenase/sirohydrochlorin ferrochelatase [Chloroflexi bacterium]|nr:bifunctional precorrin-2 dehydrogenase/sirohydrochlorin ferrochelatase [Chloroflexota bacterium]
MTSGGAGYYPIFLRLEDRPCVVVGGGGVAERKIRSLLEAGARVTVVAPAVTPPLRDLARAGDVVWYERGYEPGDLAGAFLAFAASDRRGVNRAVGTEARERNIPFNAADSPAECTFVVPATVREGDLTIAISTSGQSPAVARRLRLELQTRFVAGYAELLRWLGALRAPVKEWCPDPVAREELFRAVAESDVLDWLRQGDRAEAAARLDAIAGSYSWWRGRPTDPLRGPVVDPVSTEPTARERRP